MFKMGVGVAALKIFEKLFKEGFFNKINSVMEIGAQELSCSGYLGSDPFDHQIYPTDEEVIPQFLKTIGKDEKISIKNGDSAKIIYELLGVKEYECIDADGKFGAHIFDLNKEIDREYDYKKQYDLVTNHGTTEHVFNQYACFKNIHNLTKVGGYMIHAVPFIGYIYHCLYRYSKTFFTSLAKDNNYEIKGMWIGYTSIDTYSEENVKKYRNEPKVMIICLLKKTNTNSFRIPFQNEYIKTSKLK